jgi:hypothetical protein
MMMRTGRLKRQRGGSIYIPDEIFITSIPGVSEIEKFCRKRIKENAPLADKTQ